MHLFTHRKISYHWLIFQLLSHKTSLREVWNAAEKYNLPRSPNKVHDNVHHTCD